MHRDLAKVAAIFVSAYVVLGMSALAEPLFFGAGLSVAWVWLVHSWAWLPALVGTVVAIGLWQHFKWAWWLGLVAASIQFLRIVQFWVTLPPVAFESVINHSLIVAFLFVLSLRQTRTLCVRPLHA